MCLLDVIRLTIPKFYLNRMLSSMSVDEIIQQLRVFYDFVAVLFSPVEK